MLSILSRPRRFHRPVIHYVFASLLSEFQLENIEHIFEVFLIYNIVRHFLDIVIVYVFDL